MELKHVEHILKAGRVKRYHTFPTVTQQDNGNHSYGVAAFCMYLTDEACSANLLMAAILHDTSELVLGDLPFTAKRDHASLKTEYTEAEHAVRDALDLPMPELTEDEQTILHHADRLEMVMYGWSEYVLGNGHAQEIIGNILKSYDGTEIDVKVAYVLGLVERAFLAREGAENESE